MRLLLSSKLLAGVRKAKQEPYAVILLQCHCSNGQAVCPVVVYLLKHLIHFVIDTKTVDTCFYTWMCLEYSI
jgi:hypothetical protein